VVSVCSCNGYQHNHERAIEDFTKAIELKPDYAEAYFNSGIAYGNQGNHESAIEKKTILKP
jgi:tetratricopeptide (TPR) repeat protein